MMRLRMAPASSEDKVRSGAATVRRNETLCFPSGKGAPEYWVAVIRPGRMLFEMAGVTPEVAREAMRQLGIEPQSPPIRGGTDGSCLSQRGLPTPNLSNGSHNPHGPLEWVAVQDMEMAGRVCLELVQLWAQKGAGYRGYAKRD